MFRDRLEDAIAHTIIRFVELGDPAEKDATIARIFQLVHAHRARAGSGRYRTSVHDDPVAVDDDRPTDPAPPHLDPRCAGRYSVTFEAPGEGHQKQPNS